LNKKMRGELSMITTQKEKAFAGELKELMKKHGVRIEADENYNSATEQIEVIGRKFVGPDIDVSIDDFEFWRSTSRDTNHVANQNSDIAA
jgi:hypothetical protein